MGEPVEIDRLLADPDTYEDAILRIFEKRRQRGMAYADAEKGVTFFDTATKRRSLSRAIARSVAEGNYRPQPVDLWFLETRGKRRAAHMPAFIDHVVGSALYQLLSRNARCYGLPGVYSYLPGLTNATAMRTLAAFVRGHRKRVGTNGPPLHVLQSDFEKYGDTLPVGPDAPLWPILRDVASLGSPDGISQRSWDLITALARPVVRDQDGSLFTRLRGVAMGTPIVPLLANLAVVPMDRAILAIEGIFYARYNDDFIVAHPDLAAIHEADARIDALLEGLGVTRKPGKELRTALSGNGMPSTEDPAYLGRNRIDCLGLSVFHTGTTAVGPHHLRRFIERVSDRIDGAASALAPLAPAERARHLVAATNVMLDATSPFAVQGLSAVVDNTTDRGVLEDLDFRIARKIAQAATGRLGVRGFRLVPPLMLRGELGLLSLVHLRNLR
jgi:hypothetical protein